MNKDEPNKDSLCLKDEFETAEKLYDPVELEEDEELTSALLGEFMLDTMEIEYDNAPSLVDYAFDHNETEHFYTLFIAPKPGLTETEVKQAKISISRFLDDLNEINESKFTRVKTALNQIEIQSKMDLLDLLSKFLKTRGLSIFNLMEIGYSDHLHENAQARKEHVAEIIASAKRGVTHMQGNPAHIYALLTASFMRPYKDLAGFIGSTQHVCDILEEKEGDAGFQSLIFSNAYCILSEKILLESRGRPVETQRNMAPRHIIN